MIHFNNKEHGAKIAAAIPRAFDGPNSHVISRTENGKLLGGVFYESCTGPMIFAHQASFSKHWLCRDLLWVMFHYPFVQLGCNKICGTIPSSNADLLQFNLKLGFTIETSVKGAYPDGDMLIMSMLRNECRWLNVKPRSLQAGPQ